MASKSLNDIRSTFLNYFKKNDHKIVESSNLVPNNDPTLMFANSGMVQFKNVFTGLEKREYLRATTSQKCVRAGGKHNDLENVGYTPRHHTFFEMLGNFSFGDYFKDKAISLAWDVITKEFGLKKDRLYVTVFNEDNDAFNLWKKISGLSQDRIIKISTSDNFWSMGETGPCGPCSEIFYDHGDHLKGGPPGSTNQDGDRFIEIWNLVFMQFEQISKERRINLPKPSVDTGMGLERISALLQGTHDNYQTDHFKKLISSTSEILKIKADKENIASFRVISDHLRASSFLIAEGVLPSNEGRGYVLRRIMRRGMRHSHLLGSKEPIFYKILKTLINEMSSSYPELLRAEALISETLKMEEEKFLVLLERGMNILEEETKKVKDVFPGDIAFKLYDTYGFPLDLTQDVLRHKSIKVDSKVFDQLMANRREDAKKNWKGSGDRAVDHIWFNIREKLGPTDFLGYETDNSQGVVLSIIHDGKEIEILNEDKEGIIITNQTPFYGESGGQIGDTGFLLGSKSRFEVTDTQKKLGDLHIHIGKLIKGSISKGDTLDLKIDSERRSNIRAYHSATHLLSEALRRILGKHVTQKGSFVGPDRLRFDFSHMKPISKDEVNKIENYVNSMVESKGDVRTRLMTPKEAVANGALALFGEKYGDEVRVLSMGNDKDAYFSTELCGGTHVRNTSEIGNFKIISQSAIAAGVRRVEALRASQLTDYLNSKKIDQENKDKKLQANINQIKNKIKSLGGEINQDAQDLNKLKNQYEKLLIDSILKDRNKNQVKDEIVNKIKIRFQKIQGFPTKELRSIIDQGKKDLKEGIIIAYAIQEQKLGIAIGITKELSKKISSVDLVKIGSSVLGGKGGGGRNDFAQAGGEKIEKIDESYKEILKKIN
jgi:alanyl-tRNA synthetase|tara:strand:+ start:1025 stop:3682 length:2658 start_codon:yes stop_codon:yes gene_type:complete